MRADRGTENVLVAAVQMAFRDEHGDNFAGNKAFRYGRSTSNTVSQYKCSLPFVFVHFSTMQLYQLSSFVEN